MRAGVLMFALLGCGKSAPTVPPEVDTWARQILALPVADVCDGSTLAGYFCRVRPALITGAARDLGATITLQAVGRPERYLDFDWGGGHVEAHGVLIGPAGWTHTANTERGERRLRDGVFAYDLRE